MIIIRRRYNEDGFEQIATYQDGELAGDADFIESFGYLFEGEVDEPMILEQFSGPNLVASIPDEEDVDESTENSSEQNRVSRPGEGASATEIARWMDEDFGQSLAEGISDTVDQMRENE